MVKSFTYIYETLGASKEETRHLTARESDLGVLESIDYSFYKKKEK